jgi:predicted site-specific integrase-resolvase
MNKEEKIYNIKPAEAASIMNIEKGTLANWRSAGKGPAFFKSGHVVRYSIDDIKEWQSRRLMKSTQGFVEVLKSR